VGPGTLVEGSTIGPDASISGGCEIRGSGVADSIVMEGCRIVGVPGIEGSILVARGGPPRGGRVRTAVLGDQSRVEVD